eukprot:evm.model.scf_513EXC.3 EVM.evm.TU.scf_513EXC.3   scf_513EXC:65915-68059(-)
MLGRRGAFDAAIGARLSSQARGLAWARPAVASRERTTLGGNGAPVEQAPQFGPVVKARGKAPKFRSVLALDGGGTRGMISTMVLKTLEQTIKDYIVEHREEIVFDEGNRAEDRRIRSLVAEGRENFEIDLADYFDMIAGTSIGSIIATYLTTRGGCSEGLLEEPEFVDYARENWPLRKGTPGALEAIFRLRSKDIFPKPWYDWIPIVNQFPGMFWVKFDPKGLNAVLKAALGDRTLKHCETSLVVPTFELKTSRPVDFWARHVREDNADNVTGYTAVKILNKGEDAMECKPDRELFTSQDPQESSDVELRDFKLRELAAASAAFPMMFPASPITFGENGTEDQKYYSDGGLIASNPTTAALSHLREQRDVPLGEIAVLSLGCGVVLPDRREVKEAGLWNWLKKGNLISVLLDQKSEYIQSIVEGIYTKVLKDAPKGQYTRVQIAVDHLDEEFRELIPAINSTSDHEKVEDLREVGVRVGGKYEEPVKRFVYDILMAQKTI